jgi:hypothetical protein
MGRGQFTLFDNIFSDKPSADLEKKARQTIHFHELLAHRYYFYAQIRLFRYDVCLNELAKENFRSTETIIDILSDTRQLVKNVVDTKPSIKELKTKYPWLTWEA